MTGRKINARPWARRWAHLWARRCLQVLRHQWIRRRCLPPLSSASLPCPSPSHQPSALHDPLLARSRVHARLVRTQAPEVGIEVAFSVSHVTIPGKSGKPTALYFDKQVRCAWRSQSLESRRVCVASASRVRLPLEAGRLLRGTRAVPCGPFARQVLHEGDYILQVRPFGPHTLMSVPSVDAAPVAAGRCARLRFAGGAAWSTAAPSLAASCRRHAIRGIAITRPGTARNLAARHRWWCAAAARDHMWRCEVRPVSDGKPYSAAAATERIPAQPLLLRASCLPALPDSLYAHKTLACHLLCPVGTDLVGAWRWPTHPRK